MSCKHIASVFYLLFFVIEIIAAVIYVIIVPSTIVEHYTTTKLSLKMIDKFVDNNPFCNMTNDIVVVQNLGYNCSKNIYCEKYCNETKPPEMYTCVALEIMVSTQKIVYINDCYLNLTDASFTEYVDKTNTKHTNKMNMLHIIIVMFLFQGIFIMIYMFSRLKFIKRYNDYESI